MTVSVECNGRRARLAVEEGAGFFLAPLERLARLRSRLGAPADSPVMVVESSGIYALFEREVRPSSPVGWRG